MTKALFLGLPLHGHTNPSLPLVRELVGRGDEVVYYSADPFAARIEQTGARLRRIATRSWRTSHDCRNGWTSCRGS